MQQRVLDRRRPPPRGQQGEVQVHPAVPRDRQRRRWYQRAVGDNRSAVRGEFGEPREERRFPGTGRGQHLDPVRVGPRAGRRADQVPAPPRRRVRPGQHREKLVLGRGDRVERGYRHRRGTREHQPHLSRPGRASRAGCSSAVV